MCGNPIFELGALVRLNSGGPVMTVVDPEEVFGFVECEWFLPDGTLFTHMFKPETLQEFTGYVDTY